MKAEIAKHPASESTVIAAINNEPSLKKQWRTLSSDQKRLTLERAAGCTESDCLMKAMANARIEQLPLLSLDISV
jgi:hypothetical protein